MKAVVARQTDAEHEAAACSIEHGRLRALQRLARSLNAAGLWLSPARLARFLQLQKFAGREFEQRIIVPLLSPADYAYLSDTGAGTLSGGRPRIRMPLIAAFGHEIGVAFHCYLHGGAHGRGRTGRICALFNVFIALFDSMCDRQNEGFVTPVTAFDEPLLRSLAADADTLNRLKHAATCARHPALRALLAIFAAFYGEVRALAELQPNSPAFRRLNQGLIDAYRAEIATVGAEASRLDPGELQRAAQRKSVLPFEIMLAVAELDGIYRAGADARLAERFARHIGIAMALTDDLVDLTRDFLRGDANTILVRVPLSNEGLPRSDQLDDAVDVIVTNLAAAIELANCSGLAMDPCGFRETLLGFTQSWLRAADRQPAGSASS